MVCFTETGQIQNYVRLIFQLTKIPMSLYVLTDDAEHYHRIFLYPDIIETRSLDIPQNIVERFSEIGMNMSKSVVPPLMYTEKDVYVFFCIPFIVIRKPGQLPRKMLLSVGPCFQEPVQKDDNRIRNCNSVYYWKDRGGGCFRCCTDEQIQAASKHIPFWNLPHLCAVIRIFYVMLFNQQISVAEIMDVGVVHSDTEFSAMTTAELFERRERCTFHTPYSEEQKIWNIVQDGDVDAVSKALQIQIFKTPGILAKTRIRHEKNLAVCTTAIATRAAILGGLPDDIAYAMSDSFILKIEEMNYIPDVVQSNNDIIIEFTKAVSEYKHKQGNIYSSEVRKCINYVEQNLHSKFTLNDMSEELHVCVSQISRKFKNETGESFVDFCTRQRINEARRLLEFSEKSILEISTILAFSSQSYFSAKFKEYTGKSPLDYRLHYHPADTRNSIK
jgi:AraC-like DNA-binding protein